MNQRLVICGNVKPSTQGFDADKTIRLKLWGNDWNVHLRITDINRKLVSDIPDRLVDLIEIATYVYCADQAATRGGDGVVNVGGNWGRFFQFHIPVRDLDFWNSASVKQILGRTLRFLSDDHKDEFHFYKLRGERQEQKYFDFSDGLDGSRLHDPQEVVLFSGGLDSLGGALKELLVESKKPVLISHWANTKIYNYQKDVVEELKKIRPNDVFHVPVRIQKTKLLSKEYTQRSRSFLYASIAAVVARLMGLERIRFYENGVVSLNLPISPQVIGGKATRTTHPLVLNSFSELFTMVFDRSFKVENPCVWHTKTDVIKNIIEMGHGNMINHTVSCSHTWEITKAINHCGSCSQCIDRRLAVVAAKGEEFDDNDHYLTELFKDARPPGVDRTMLESFVRTAYEIKAMDADRFFAKYQEITRIYPYLPGSCGENLKRIHNLYCRNAKFICDVIEKAVKENVSDFIAGKLHESCLIALCFPDKYKITSKVPQITDHHFPTPAGATWEDMTITFKDRYTFQIKFHERFHIPTMNVAFWDMGLGNKRNGKPKIQWKLLLDFSDGYGVIDWSGNKASHDKQKCKEDLSKALKKFFGIDRDPIELTKGKNWKTRFALYPESYVPSPQLSEI